MNILFIHNNFRLFNNLDCGAANRNTIFVRSLVRLGHVDIISFFDEQIKSNIDNCNVVYNSPISTNRRKFDKVLKVVKLLLFPWLPYGYYDYNKEYLEIIEKQLRKKQYDYIACRYIGTAVNCGLDKYADILIIDVDDNPTNTFKNILKTGNIKHFWTKWLMLWKITFANCMTERYLNKIRYSFFSNMLEPPSRKSVFLHNVSVLDEKIPNINEETPFRLLTVGHLNYSPNRCGVIHFVEHIFPKIRKQISDVELCIVGKSKDESLIKRLNSYEGVKTLGYVEDLSLAYKECRVVIIPVYQGSGTCVKFAEALMMNRPIVSTPVGARGFQQFCISQKHYILANNDIDFINGVVSLLSSLDKSKVIAKNAYNVGKVHFSQERFFEIVAKTINGMNN